MPSRRPGRLREGQPGALAAADPKVEPGHDRCFFVMTQGADRLLVVSPVYNEAAHLERTARAVAAQRRRPDRWVIVDDGSTDETVAVARRWERELDFLTVLEAPQDVGPGVDNLALARPPRAFNLGLGARWVGRLRIHRQARRRRRASP